MELDKNTTALLVIDAIEAVGDDSLYDPANSLSIPGGKHHLDYPQIALMLDSFVPQCKQDTHAD